MKTGGDGFVWQISDRFGSYESNKKSKAQHDQYKDPNDLSVQTEKTPMLLISRSIT